VALAGLLELDATQILPFSTGVILEPLPVDRLKAGLPTALANQKPAHWFEAVELLMAQGADPTIPNADGDTPIDNAQKSPLIWNKVKHLFPTVDV